MVLKYKFHFNQSGNSGVGKSSLINHLLSVDIADISDEKSETRSTTEFIVKAPVKSLAVSNLSLGIIDTPGFNDTSGLKQDACNLFSTSSFCRTLFGDNLYPNIVLLCIQATDNRFMGPKSSFSKTLQAIRSLNIVDQQKPNVIVVITWACSIPFNDRTKWENKLIEKGRKINEILRDTLGVHAPVAWLENEFAEVGLEHQREYTTLPNGELQPSNLYQKIIQLMRENNDALGQITFQEMFGRSGERQPFEIGHSVEAKVAEDNPLSPEETQIFATLKESSTSGADLPEVTKRINRYISEKGKDLSEVIVTKHARVEVSSKLLISSRLKGMRLFQLAQTWLRRLG